MTSREDLTWEAARVMMEATHGEDAWRHREPLEEELYLRRACAAFTAFAKHPLMAAVDLDASVTIGVVTANAQAGDERGKSRRKYTDAQVLYMLCLALEEGLEGVRQQDLGERVLSATFNYFWSEDRQEWWVVTNFVTVELINPKTGRRYAKGWRSNTLELHADRWPQDPRHDVYELTAGLIDALRPRTKVVVTEVAA